MHIDINILTLYNNSGETHQPKQPQIENQRKGKGESYEKTIRQPV